MYNKLWFKSSKGAHKTAAVWSPVFEIAEVLKNEKHKCLSFVWLC